MTAHAVPGMYHPDQSVPLDLGDGLRGRVEELERRVTADAALDELHTRVRWHYDLACDAEQGDLAAANQAALRYAHVLDMITDLRDELTKGVRS